MHSKTLLFFVMLLAFSSFVSAAVYIDDSGYRADTSNSAATYYGMTIQILNTSYLRNFTLDSRINCNQINVYWNNTLIENNTRGSSNSYVMVNFTGLISAGSNITIIPTNRTGACTNYFRATYTQLPITKSNVKWLNSTNSNFVKGVDYWGIDNITTETVSTSTPSITFYNQTPSDITAVNLFSYPNVSIIYSFNTLNGTLNNNSISINYLVNTSNSNGCWIITNGSGTMCGYQNKSYNNANNLNYTFLLGTETDIYPGIYMYNQINMLLTPKSDLTQTGINNLFSIRLDNVSSNTKYNYLETYFNATVVGSPTAAQLYYCNSSYDFSSQITSNSNCYLYDSLDPHTRYNHTHTIYSSHILKPVVITSNKIGTVSVSSTSYFVIKVNSNANTYDLRYITNESVLNQIMTSNNGGTTWTTTTGTADAHLHQFDSNEYLKYYVTGNISGSYYNSSLNLDNLDLTLLPLTAPTVIIPYTDYNVTTPLNITYNPTTSTGSFYFNYTISLYYSNDTYAQLINVTNQSYYTFYNNLNIGDYYINVTANDEYGQKATALSGIFHRLGFLNITAYNNITGSLITSFSIYKNGTLDGSTSTGSYKLDNLQLGTYSITIDAATYEIKNVNLTLSSGVTYYNFSLMPTNSIYLRILDENTGLNITDNVSVRFSNVNTGEFTNYTVLAYLLNSDLRDGEYQLFISTANYSSRTYTVTLYNRSSITLNAYLSRNITTTLFTITDKSTAVALQGVLSTMYRNIGGVWVPVESKYTDITGKVQFTYTPSQNYKFYLSKTDYQDYVFYLEPILFSSYDIKMTKQIIINNSYDYDKVSIIYAPSVFRNNNVTTFNWIIQAPYGGLTSYGFNITYPGGSNLVTGNNAIGSQLSATLNITGASATDRIRLDYYYISSLAGNRNFTVYLSITDPSTYQNTFMENKNNTYGLGLFERVIILMLCLIFVIGIATMLGRPIEGLVMGMFIGAYFAYIGFISLWLILPSLIIGFIMITWKSG